MTIYRGDLERSPGPNGSLMYRMRRSVRHHNISTHWLRHTTSTWVERHHGCGTARAYAGHTDTRTAPTTTYIHAQLPEIAIALSTLTREPHPLADGARCGQLKEPAARPG